MLWRIEVRTKKGLFDSIGHQFKKDILDLGIKRVEKVNFIQVYYIDGAIKEVLVEKIAGQLLTDSVTQKYSYSLFPKKKEKDKNNSDVIKIEIAYHTGVMDPWEESIRKGINNLGIEKIEFIKTSKEYIIKGSISKEQIDEISKKVLMNPLIQHVVKDEKDILSKPKDYEFELIEIAIENFSNEELINLSKKMQLSLNLQEMQAIKKYFSKLDRKPTDVELETLAQTWSEHCKHKTMMGPIEYTEVNGKESISGEKEKKVFNIENLLKETVMKVTRELDKSWCVSVFIDNAGIIKFNDEYNICFKVETHNHPSALEPYGGANTGIGGVIRDPLGTGLGSKPIFNTDIFCFAPPDYPQKKLPDGILHPKRIMKGVVSGVRDYGNKMGIPTINGAIVFDEDYLGNPLVYCGNAGIMPKEASFKKVVPGDLVVSIGGRTGRDGIHGATFSSAELTQESETVSSQAVQIGNPITEKKMEKVVLRARDEGLYNAITDCGAGGLSSAVGELGEDTGAKVDLEQVPLKYKGLRYDEIWISEAQERMVLVVPKEKLDRLIKICKEEEVELANIGEFTNDKKLKLFYKGNKVADLDMGFLHDGLPKTKRKAVWKKEFFNESELAKPDNLNNDLINVLSGLNVASKEWVIRQYDHEVQGISVLKPLVGIDNDGPSDASVVRPLFDSEKCVGISCGINSRFGKVDPYWMTASVIDEAIRQLVAVGFDIDRIALLDNFCWGNTDKPEQLGSLVRSSLACYDIAKKFGTPFISGKDSLNNEFNIEEKSVPIPSTLLISAIGILDCVSYVKSMDLKKAGNLIYVLGLTYDELGGSEYYNYKDFLGNKVPKVNPEESKILYKKLHKAITSDLVSSVHDCSEGGIGVACAEMAFAGGLGMEIALNKVSYSGRERDDFVLFSESNSRFVVEIDKKNKEEFEKTMEGTSVRNIGSVSENKEFQVYGLEDNKIISVSIDELKKSWQEPLKF